MTNRLRPHTHIIAFIVLTLGLIPLSMAAVYLHKDEDGNIILSDTPKEDATILTTSVSPPKTPQTLISSRRIQLDDDASYTVASQTITTQKHSNRTNKQPTAPYYQSLSIIRPAPNAIITSPSGSFKVAVNIQPLLKNHHKIQLLIDGKVRGALHGYRFKISKAADGEHALQVNIIDPDQNIIKSSETIHFSVIRTAR